MNIHIPVNALLFPNLNQLLKEHLHCPNCGARKVSIIVIINKHLVKLCFCLVCFECKFQGTPEQTLQEAVASWKRPIGRFAMRLKRLENRWSIP
jgi:hypothetical protein